GDFLFRFYLLNLVLQKRNKPYINRCASLKKIVEREKLTTKFIKSLESILETIDLESIDDILDLRDSDSFSNLWKKAWNQIESEKINTEKEREKIFKLIYSKTESGDLSAYITEDFELIMNFIGLRESNWVTSLCQSYFTGKIPIGILKNSEKTLIELINE
ncbi:hypothetical protein, partial [Tenacibaculum finnmarkense]|uniref:hypothetical protein n=1 Tax=Tenacibaculum finnmarkense TaxID=2781243 RepID=UPI003BB70988